LIAENAFVKVKLWAFFAVNLDYFNRVGWAISAAHGAIRVHQRFNVQPKFPLCATEVNHVACLDGVVWFASEVVGYFGFYEGVFCCCWFREDVGNSSSPHWR
jgi:hypothetical protein